MRVLIESTYLIMYLLMLIVVLIFISPFGLIAWLLGKVGI